MAELKREVRIDEAEMAQANGSGPDVARRLRRLQGDLAAMTADRIRDADVADAVSEFSDLWSALAYSEQAEVVAALVERVEYDGSDVTITFAEPAHV